MSDRLSRALSALGDGLGTMYQHQLYTDEQERRDRRMAAVERMENERLLMAKERHGAQMELAPAQLEAAQATARVAGMEAEEFESTADQRARMRELEVQGAEAEVEFIPLERRRLEAQTQSAELQNEVLQAQISEIKKADPVQSIKTYAETSQSLAGLAKTISENPDLSPEQRQAQFDRIAVAQARLDIATGMLNRELLKGPSSTDFREIAISMDFNPDNLTEDQEAQVWSTMLYPGQLGGQEESEPGFLSKAWEFSGPAFNWQMNKMREQRTQYDEEIKDAFNWLMNKMREQGIQYDEEIAEEEWDDKWTIP